jgi:hypothetical protein
MYFIITLRNSCRNLLQWFINSSSKDCHLKLSCLSDACKKLKAQTFQTAKRFFEGPYAALLQNDGAGWRIEINETRYSWGVSAARGS